MSLKKNENQIILIFLLSLLLIQCSTNNLCLCEAVPIESISVAPEQTINYKKILLYSLGTFVIIGLCYYFFTPNIDPGIYEIPFRKNAAVFKEIYINAFKNSMNSHLNNLSDMIVTRDYASVLNLPRIHMSDFELNSLDMNSKQNFDLLYTLPKDSLVAFSHHMYDSLYQVITVEQLLTVVEKFNIIVS